MLVDWRKNWTRGSRAAYALQMSSVPSVEALLEMISSKSSNVWPSRESRDWARKSAPLYTGKPMLSLGLLMRSNSFVADSERLPRRQNRTMANLGVRSGHADVAFRGARLYIWFRCRAGNRNAHDRE